MEVGQRRAKEEGKGERDQMRGGNRHQCVKLAPRSSFPFTLGSSIMESMATVAGEGVKFRLPTGHELLEPMSPLDKFLYLYMPPFCISKQRDNNGVYFKFI